MSVRLPVPTTAHSTIDLTLSASNYLFTYRYNSRSSRWKLDLSLADGTTVKNGLTLVEEFSPTAYLNLEDFTEGMLYVMTNNSTDTKCSRSNLGVNKDYQLVYVAYSELEA